MPFSGQSPKEKNEIEKERGLYYKSPKEYIKKSELQNLEVQNFLKKLNLSRKKENSIKIVRIKLSEKFGSEIGMSVPTSWIQEYKPKRVKRWLKKCRR